MARRYGKSVAKNVKRVMKKRKKGTLRSGRSGRKVKSREQAIAIALSESRRAGKKVPKKGATKRKKAGKKENKATRKTTRKRTAN